MIYGILQWHAPQWIAAGVIGLWVACGMRGAHIQRRYWQRHKQPVGNFTVLDYLANGVLGPVAWIGNAIAYPSDE